MKVTLIIVRLERDHDLGEQGLLSAELAEPKDELKKALGLVRPADDVSPERLGGNVSPP